MPLLMGGGLLLFQGSPVRIVDFAILPAETPGNVGD